LYIDRLIYHKDRESPELKLKGRFFIYSTLVFFLLCFVTVPYFIFVRPEEVSKHPAFFVSNLVMLLLVLLVIFFYKKFGRRVLLVNLITILGWSGNIATYETTGGIFSPDNMWGIFISSWVFLVANRRSGTFWFVVTGLTLTCFYIAEKQGLRNFRSISQQLDANYFYFNYLLAVIFLYLIIYLYETGKNEFLAQIKKAKGEIEHKNKDIMDSINYAKKIQYAVLPHEETIFRSAPLSFIYYSPKDVVSGDFYWFHEINADEYIFVCADCTGHGVPGAFMTVVCSNLLNQTVIDNRIFSPAAILTELERLLNVTLKQDNQRLQGVQDGMDLSLIHVNKATRSCTLASARRPVLMISGNEMREIRASKFSLGGMVGGVKNFHEEMVAFGKEDLLFMYTDGFTDQFGGPKGKKYSSRRLREFILSIRNDTAQVQKQKLSEEFSTWSSGFDQVDDVCVVGVRF
jgi:serine phosphatase RsbU (regulator of sigma subunit)